MNFSSEYVLNIKSKKNVMFKSAKSQSSLPNIEDEDSPNTNVVSIKFNQLKEIADMHVGDPIKCSYCDAYLSNISQVNFTKRPVWKCEFCQRENYPQIDIREIPKSRDVTFIINPSNEQDSLDSSNIIYCIDISGSMSVTTSIPGNISLPTDKSRKQKDKAIYGEYYQESREEQGSRRYISRLEAVQAAIADNLDKLKNESPNKRVGLVAFNDQVHVYGDGAKDPTVLSDTILESKEKIEKKAQEVNELLPINKTFEKLYDKLISLEEGGATALGPAILYSIRVASRRQGSRVILCTDGLANKGVGSLEDSNYQESVKFYYELGNYAVEKGVSISIITLKETDCRLGLLGDLADRTNGIVNIVDPFNLRKEFSSILEEKIIATSVEATFLLHKNLYVKDNENSDQRLSKVSRKIGNVTQETEITFEYGVRDSVWDDTKESKFPFQLQILYISKDGTKALRIQTQLKTITNDRQLAEQHADRTILTTHFVQSNARFLQRSREPELQSKAIKKHANWDNYIRNLKTSNDDEFSEEKYSNVASDMERVLNAPRPTSALQSKASYSNQNTYAEMNDEDASRAYKLANIKSKSMKKTY